MSSQWTAIHEYLGLPVGELTFSNVKAAVDTAMPESDWFDWKEPLPWPPDNGRWNEYAKDVAAMANTRGGLLVYGVADKPIAYRGIDLAEARRSEQRYAQWLRNHIQPYLAGVVYQYLESDSKGEGLMLVHVPASPSAPHLVYGTSAKDRDQQAFVPPYRDRDHTAWMGEAQLARAYVDRFARVDRFEESMSEAAEPVFDLMESNQAWLVVTARPQLPLPALAPKIDRSEPAGLLERALYESAQLRDCQSLMEVLKRLEAVVRSPRPGLRSWVVSNRGVKADQVGRRGIYVELGHDGSVVFAVDVSTDSLPDGSESPDNCLVVNAELIDHAMGEAVAVAQVLNRHLGNDSQLIFQVVLPAVTSPVTVLRCATRQAFEGTTVPSTSRAVQRIRSVRGAVSAQSGRDATYLKVSELSSDVLHQFGIEPPIHR